MDFHKAIDVKTSISYSFLNLQQKYKSAFVFNAALPAARISSVHKSMQATINGVGIGEKPNGESFIKVLTKRKTTLNPALLSGYFGVNKQDIVIQETGPIRFRTATNKHRPPYPGISIGHYKVSAGTLGCFVKDESNHIYILSNNHVIANTNKGRYKDPVLQPGNNDGGKKAKDTIAELSYLVELDYSGPNKMDASIAAVIPGMKYEYLLNNKRKTGGVIDPANKMKVEKFGRTTGHTKGKITARNLDIKVDFDGVEIEFEDQFEVAGNRGIKFCDDGDSGSLVFESESAKAVGLLFAGADDGTAFVTPIKTVLREFAIKIL